MFWKRKKGNDADTVRIFFASDLHGSTVCFKKFLNGAQFYGANVLVLGGDLTGKAVIPLCEQEDGSVLAHRAGGERRLVTVEEVEEFKKSVGNMGFYPAEMNEAEFQTLKNDSDGQTRLFKRLVCDRIAEWSELATAKLNGTDIPLVTAPGNDDFFEIDQILGDAPHVDYQEMTITEVRGYEMLHCGGSTKTPWDTEREYTEEEYAARFAKLVPQVKDMSRCIFNVHVPPYGTVLDQCPKLDDNLQVVFEMGNPVQMHAGSSALTETIEKAQPLLGLHGHIHEGRGNIKIGNSVCVNPGSVYPEGILQGVLVTLRDGTVESVQMTQG